MNYDKESRKECAARARKAEKLVCAAYEGEADMESSIVDLMADLRHLCDELGYDADALHARACEHHDIERVGESDPRY